MRTIEQQLADAKAMYYAQGDVLDKANEAADAALAEQEWARQRFKEAREQLWAVQRQVPPPPPLENPTARG